MTPDDAVQDPTPPELAGPRRAVEVVTHYLEMFAPPPRGPGDPPRPGVDVVRARRCSPRFYRYLYDAVGAPWHWYDRRRTPTEQLAALLADERVEVHVLWQGGVPLGYAELDRRIGGEVELAYFGLLPEAIGQKLGPWLLAWAIATAWQPPGVNRVWVHTCSLDHPAALPCYLAAGFAKYDEHRHRQLIVEPAET